MENLIILGAGGYGRTAAETARAMGVFGRVAFLDDGCTGTDILGPCTDYIRFAGEFRWAYPAFGANALRAAWLEKLAAAGYSLPAYPLDGSGEFREFFAEEGVRNVPEWYERKLGVPPQLYAQLPARTIVAVRDAANRRRAFVLDGVRHAQDAGFAGLAKSGLSRTLPPEGLAELLDAVMAFLLGDPVREGARPGAVRFVSRVF